MNFHPLFSSSRSEVRSFCVHLIIIVIYIFIFGVFSFYWFVNKMLLIILVGNSANNNIKTIFLSASLTRNTPRIDKKFYAPKIYI